MKPAFSSTRADARLFANTSAEIRRNGKFSKQKSVISYLLLQEFMGVIDCVRMRKEVAQTEPNFSVVRVLRERVPVIQSPWANGAAP